MSSSSPKKAKFEIFKGKDNQYHWRFRAKGNHEIVAQSEAYTTKQNCQHGIDVLKEQAGGADTDDQTK